MNAPYVPALIWVLPFVSLLCGIAIPPLAAPRFWNSNVRKMAVALVLSTNYEISRHVLAPGGNTIAANIALQYGFAGTVGIDALIASGMVLFVITLVVNMSARLIIARRREFSGANS